MVEKNNNVININSKSKNKKRFKCIINWAIDKFPLEIEAEKGLQILDHSSHFLMLKESETTTYYINPSKVLTIVEKEIKND